MEDESDTQDGSGEGPESLLPYDRWTEDALRQVVVRALAMAAEQGLPGQHHYYLTFRTDFPGVTIPARLRAKYPEEMTIVLQHQFDNLTMDEATGLFGVTLSFGGVPSPLTVPLGAITAFVDPHVQFGLRFRVVPPAEPPAETTPAAALPAPSVPDAAETSDEPQVVSLDAFRRKRD